MSVLTIPFSFIVGLDDAKLALILNIIDPQIGGVLISGAKGTGKSSLVRSLKGILPTINTIKGCFYNCSPGKSAYQCEDCKKKVKSGVEIELETKNMTIVTLPLGATEDRVIGSLNIEKVIEKGIEEFSPGILAEANQHILYVDEINLLPDHLVDSILDCAASGWNIIERENISVRHPSRFVLIGTMNPEEGDLRPQLLDRLSLFAEASNIIDTKQRMKIIELNLAESYTFTDHNFSDKELNENENIKIKIVKARQNLKTIVISEEKKKVIVTLCMKLGVDGFRGDIAIARSSRALASFEGQSEVTLNHILKSANLALLHRTRNGGMQEPPSKKEIEENFNATLDLLKIRLS